MKTHTNGFKTNIAKIGRDLDSIITYELNGDTVELGTEQLNSITPHYKADILKSVMKQLDIDSSVDIPIGTVINYQFGVKVGQAYEYLDFGNYIVNKSERQEDLYSYKITCYDKMLLSMVDYVDMGITYPITIRDYISTICTHLGITFANGSDTFTNYEKEIPKELFLSDDGNSLGYTFRDVLDQLAQVTASTICINDDDELEIRYITETNDTIDEDYFKNVNVDFGKKYGPINSIVLSRSAGADNIDLQDDASILINGLCELKISDNLIMNDNDRDTYLADIFARLNGLEYYINDFSSTGIMYYEMCDRYTAHIGDNNYSCVMLNDEALVTKGLQENIHTDMPIVSETDYSKSDKTDQRINQTYIIVNKQKVEIESLASRTTTLENDDKAIKQKFDGYTPIGTTNILQTQVRDLQTDTYKKTEVQQILKGTFYDENNNQIVSEIVKTTSGTFDENGMTYEKTNAPTKTTINEIGVNTRRTSNNESILFAGYVDENNTEYADFKGQTIVASENIQVKNYFVMPTAHSRIEKYENGGGMFYV